MNRRGFLQSLAISTAALYLRFAPAAVQAAMIERALPKPDEQTATADDCVRHARGGLYSYKNQTLTAEQVLAMLPRRSQRGYLMDVDVKEGGAWRTIY